MGLLPATRLRRRAPARAAEAAILRVRTNLQGMSNATRDDIQALEDKLSNELAQHRIFLIGSVVVALIAGVLANALFTSGIVRRLLINRENARRMTSSAYPALVKVQMAV